MAAFSAAANASRDNPVIEENRKPGTAETGASLQEPGQRFNLTGRFKLEFRLEGCNLTNRVMPGHPNLSVTSTRFGGITSHVNYGREVQCTLRIHF